jgi:uncharacterized membrane protein YkvA (DUF1232 family)
MKFGKFFTQLVHTFVRNGIRSSKYRWLFIVASIVYLVSPLDISPDVFPVLGWLDDGMVITLLATELSQFLLERRKARKDEKSETVASSVS